MSVSDSSNPFLVDQAERSFLGAVADGTSVERQAMSEEPAAIAEALSWFEGEMRVAGGSIGAERPASEHRSAPPAVPGITAGQTSKERVWRLTGGVDKVEFVVRGAVSWHYGAVEQQLIAARQAARDRTGSTVVDVEGARLVVESYTHKWGIARFEYVAEYDGIKYSLPRADQSDKWPVAKVEISSLKLMRHGHERCFEQALQTLEALGLKPETDDLFEIHVCVDLAGVPVDHFCEAIFSGQAVSRIKTKAIAHKHSDGAWQGVSVGDRKGVQVIAYDKIAELVDYSRKSQSHRLEAEAKRAVMIQQRWGCLPDKATRVEFHIRGTWIRGQGWEGVRSTREVFEHLPEIIDYLVKGFFRLVDGEPDRENNNQSKRPMSALWVAVCDGFVEWAGEKTRELVKVAKVPADLEGAADRLFAQAESYAAMLPGYVVDENSFLQRVLDVVAERLRERGYENVAKRAEAKRIEWEKRGLPGVLEFHPPVESHWSRSAYSVLNVETGEYEEREARVRYEVAYDPF